MIDDDIVRRLNPVPAVALLTICALCGCVDPRINANYPAFIDEGAAVAAVLAIQGTLLGAGAGGGAALGGPLIGGNWKSASIGHPALRVARDVLYSDTDDRGSFGAFSYLIATQKDPGSPVGRRLRAAVEAYAVQVPYCGSVRTDMDQSHVNVFLIPVASAKTYSSEGLLCKDTQEIVLFIFTNYDIARATVFADRAGLVGPGPYLVASLQPLSLLPTEQRGSLLVWDLSAVEPQLIRLAVELFVLSADQNQSWNETSMREVAFRIRNWIAIGSQGLGMSMDAAAAVFKGPR